MKTGKNIISAIILLSLSIYLLADDIKTIDGKTYKNAKQTGGTPATIEISHENGVTTIPFSQLSDSDKKKYGYDKEAEAEYLEEMKPELYVKLEEVKDAPGKVYVIIGNLGKSTGTITSPNTVSKMEVCLLLYNGKKRNIHIGGEPLCGCGRRKGVRETIFPGKAVKREINMVKEYEHIFNKPGTYEFYVDLEGYKSNVLKITLPSKQKSKSGKS